MIDFEDFEERIDEIDAYLELIEELESKIRMGSSSFLGENFQYRPLHQKILCSNTYLHLYNLVESTISKCLESLSRVLCSSGVKPKQLSEKLREEWVRFIAQTNKNLNTDKRHTYTMKLCEHILNGDSITEFEIRKGSGNWDDEVIYKSLNRIGLSLCLTDEVERNAKKKFRDELGALGYIRKLRNDLAHGKISFSQCGENITSAELSDLKKITVAYLREVVHNFENFINNESYLTQNQRESA